MTLLEFMASHTRGETVHCMLAEISCAQAAKHAPYIGLPANKSDLERSLRLLKAQGLITEIWLRGSVEATWKVRRKVEKLERQEQLFG